MQRFDISVERIIEKLIEQNKRLALEVATLEAAVSQLASELESTSVATEGHDELNAEDSSNA